MGLFDKMKEKMNQLKEENRNFGSTMKRINKKDEFFGNVNRGVKEGDFWEGSYISFEDGDWVIYGSNQDDYKFNIQDVKSIAFVGEGNAVSGGGDQNVRSARFEVLFNDDKKAQIDVRITATGLYKDGFHAFFEKWFETKKV